jgi:hypothetical protein
MLPILFMLSTGYAGEFQESLITAREAILAEDYAKATEILNSAEIIAPTSTEILTPSEIAQIWYLHGVLNYRQGREPLDEWRQTLIIHLGHQWDEELLTDEAARDAFIALQTEIQNRPIVSLQVPEKYGHAELYVDGFLRAPSDFAYKGTHLAQIKCPNGEVFGKWTTFEKKVKWIKMCPYKFDVNDMPEPEEEDDEWAMFSSMGSDSGMIAPEVNMDNEKVAAPVWDRINKPALYSAGGAAVASTVLYAMALNGKSAFEDIDNADISSEADLDELRASTNRKAISSVTLGGAAAGLYLVAFWNLKNK